MTNAETERDPHVIEQEVDRERQRVANTIDALQSKLSSKGIFDEVAKALSEHSGEITGGLGRAVRQNPLPLILTGIGLTWLMASSGERKASSYQPPRVDHSGDGSLQPRYRVQEATTGPSTGVSGSLGGAKDALSGTVGAVGSAARDVKDAAADAVLGAKDTVSDGLSAGMERVRSAADWSGEHGRDLGRDLSRGLTSYAEEQPLVLGALALALGTALGAALPRTQTEDDLVGAEADRLKAAAKETLAAEGQKVAAVAGAVAKEATRVAEEASGKIAETASGLADQARSATERLRDVAHEESEAQKNVIEGGSEQPGGTTSPSVVEVKDTRDEAGNLPMGGRPDGGPFSPGRG